MRVVAGIEGSLDERVFDDELGEKRRAVFERVIARLKVMAGGSGLIRLRVRDVPRDVELDITKTDRGDVALVRRVLQWNGGAFAEGDRFNGWRDAMARHAFIEAIDAARALGPDATLEEIHACAAQAQTLLRDEREAEARPYAERAHELALENLPYPSARAPLAFMVAASRRDAPDVQLGLARAALELAHGIPYASFASSRIVGYARAAGRPDEALAAATATEESARTWYGGSNEDVFVAWADAAHAELDVGNVSAARARTARMRALSDALGLQHGAAIIDWTEGRALDCAGDHDAAIGRLQAARAAFADADAELDAHIAIALAGAGRVREASDAAREVLTRLSPSMTSVARRIEQLATRSGPFR